MLDLIQRLYVESGGLLILSAGFVVAAIITCAWGLAGIFCPICGSRNTEYAPCFGPDGVNPGRHCKHCGNLWSQYIGTVERAEDLLAEYKKKHKLP